MIMLQRQPTFPSSPPLAHRRHPSAPPAVIVQPTKTPGLLSLSKPIRPTPPRQHQHKQSRTPKNKPEAGIQQQQSTHMTPPTQTAMDEQHASQPKSTVKPSAEVSVAEKKVSPKSAPQSTPEKRSRGRPHGNKPAKDKTARRSTSHSSAHPQSRRSNPRQPSPPLQPPSSQAEVTESSHHTPTPFTSLPRNPASNTYDPFVVSSDSDSDHPIHAFSNSKSHSTPAAQLKSRGQSPAQVKMTTILAPQPSGKLARRRQPQAGAPATPTPASKAVPVPHPHTHRTPGSRSVNQSLSRSAPTQSALPASHLSSATHLHSGFAHKRTSTAVPFMPAEFPICDDTTDADDASMPVTPVRERAEAATWQQLVFEGPRTAPLSSSSGFPFSRSRDSSPTPAGRRRHARTPSEGVFNLSLDEDDVSVSVSGSGTNGSAEELKTTFGLIGAKRQKSFGLYAARMAKDKAGFFASSMFQNSPSPDELPPPSF